MADDLVISVGGDISSLETSLSDIPSVAAASAAKIQAAFDALPSATEGVETSLANLSQGLQESGAAAGEAAGHINTIPPALHDTEEAAGEASAKLKELLETGLELVGITITIEAIKESLKEMVAAFEGVQRAEISLTALGGDAEQARATIDQLRTLAQSEGLSFPALLTAQTRMQAFGISTQQIPGLLQAAANAAAVMNKDIETTANTLERMAASGAAGARQLSQLGLTTHDLAQAMGIADDAVKKAFASLDQSQRVQVLTDALQKFQGVAAALADTLTGRWQTLKTSIEVATEGIGEAIATGLTDVVKNAQLSVVPALESITQAFKDVAAVVGPVLIGAVNSLIQGFSELAELSSGAISLAVRAVTGDAANLNINLKSIWDRISDLTPWALFKNSMDQATTELHLLTAEADMAAKSLPIMEQRFTSVTASLQAFIDKSADNDNSLLAIRNAFDDLKQAVSDAKDKFDLVKDAYDKGYASAGQLQSALRELWNAEDALNDEHGKLHFSLLGIVEGFNQQKQAVVDAQNYLNAVTILYAKGEAGLGTYQRAQEGVKKAQEELNGALAKTPAQQVAEDYDKLQANLLKAQTYQEAVTAAMAKGAATAGMLEKANKDVANAQKELDGTTQAATASLSASGPKVIEVADAMDKLAASTNAAAVAHGPNFVGPVQQAADKIQLFGGAALSAGSSVVTLTNGVQVLTGAVSTLGDTFDATKVTVIGAGNAFSQTAADLQTYINGLNGVTTAATSATQAIAAVESASSRGFGGGGGGGGRRSRGGGGESTFFPDAASGGMSLSDWLDLAMNAPIGNVSVSLQQGDSFRMPFVGNPSQLVGVGAIGAGYNAFTQAQETQGIFGGGTVQFIPHAARALTDAASALTDAAQAQQDAATAAYEAAKASGTAAKDISAAATANDAISASTLAAADAANAAAFNASVIGTQVLGTVTQATQTVAAATALVGATVTAVAPALGISLGTNALVPGAPTPVTPAISGPGGSNTLVIPMPVNTGPWDPTVGGQARLQLTLNNSGPIVGSGGMDQLVSILGDNLVKQLQTQGIRLTRA